MNIIKRENRQLNNQRTLHLAQFSLKSTLDKESLLGSLEANELWAKYFIEETWL